jgi:hypothetical protein
MHGTAWAGLSMTGESFKTLKLKHASRALWKWEGNRAANRFLCRDLGFVWSVSQTDFLRYRCPPRGCSGSLSAGWSHRNVHPAVKFGLGPQRRYTWAIVRGRKLEVARAVRPGSLVRFIIGERPRFRTGSLGQAMAFAGDRIVSASAFSTPLTEAQVPPGPPCPSALATRENSLQQAIQVGTALVPRPNDALVPYSSPLILVPASESARAGHRAFSSWSWISSASLMFLVTGTILLATILSIARKDVHFSSLMRRWSRQFMDITVGILRSLFLCSLRAINRVVSRITAILQNLLKSEILMSSRLRRLGRPWKRSSSTASEEAPSLTSTAQPEPPQFLFLLTRILQNFWAIVRLQMLYWLARARLFIRQARDSSTRILTNASVYLEAQRSRLGDEHRPETAEVLMGARMLWNQCQQIWDTWVHARNNVGQPAEPDSWQDIRADFERKLNAICEYNMQELERKFRGDEGEIEAILLKYASLSSLLEAPNEEATRAFERATPEQRQAAIEKILQELDAARTALAPFLEQGLDPRSPEADRWIQAAEKSGITGLRTRLTEGSLRRDLEQLLTGGYDWDGEIYTADTEGYLLWKAALERLKKREDVAVRLQERIESMRPTGSSLTAGAPPNHEQSEPPTKNDRTRRSRGSLADELQLIREELSVMSDEELLTWIQRNAREAVRSGLAEKILGRLALATIAGYIFFNLIIKNDIVQQLEQIRPYAERIVRFFIL